MDPDGAGPRLADPFTPPFPAFISGHATFGAAQAAIMRNFFGRDKFAPLTIGTDDPYVPGLTRTFTSWETMARENGRSRIYLGVHWQWDADDGYTAGTKLANYLFHHYLRPVVDLAVMRDAMAQLGGDAKRINPLRPADLEPGAKWIDVDLTRQILVAFEGDRPVFATLVSSGKRNLQDKEKDRPTPTGTFRIREKHITATMDGDVAADG